MNAAHRNNVDFIRFAAATMVWYGHCYGLYDKHTDWLNSYIPFESFGGLGVTIFFIISGYFVTGSYDHNGRLLPYLRNRCLRIFPALAVVVLLAAFVLGPCVTSLGLHDYFTHPQTWKYLKSMLVFPLQYDLPGVFSGNSISAVNGSLWSLKHELRCYIAIALLGVLGILRPRLMFVLLSGLCAIRIYGVIMHLSEEDRLLTKRWGDLQLATRVYSEFAMGALLYLARERIPLKARYLVVALLLALLSTRWGECGKVAFDMALSYSIIYLGFARLPLLPHFSRFGDFSYGIYLYAFPMQQLTLALWHPGFDSFMAISFALALLCAVMSWHLVEKPALALKR